MKIRQGFVSNSSSSSYIIVGSKVPFSSVNPNNFKSIKMIPEQTSDDGYYFVDMTKEIYDYIKANPGVVRSIDFYDVVAVGEEELSIDRSKLPSKVHIFAADVTYHNPETLEDFKEIVEGGIE